MGKDQDLLEGCRTGNLAAVEKCLQGRLGNRNRDRTSKGASGVGALSSLSKSFWNLKSANINCVDASGDTPLHLAALNGHKDIVSLLLDCEASPTILDSQDCSPLHLAAWNGHTDICQLLVAASDDQAFVNLQTRDGNTALHFSAQHGHLSTLMFLLEKKADPTIRNLEDLSPLDLAAQYDRLEIVKQLVATHPELLVQRSALITPLHLASRNGHRVVVRYLIDSGFPLDAKTDKGTALHEAANFCKLDVIRLLLDRGIDVTVKSQTGCTAEDILRSIPSKAAEDALNILKTYIFHQRTPDSDGERGIANSNEIEHLSRDVPQSTPPPPRAPPSIPTPSPADRIPHLQKSLPSGLDMSTPPPIPPRQSVRLPDRHEGSTRQGLAPLIVTATHERTGDKDQSSDEDKHKLSPGPYDPCPSPRDVSPSARSPTDQPKKPPRKKPLSFRKVEPAEGPPAEPAPGAGVNYVNLDPEVERALIDAKTLVHGNSAGTAPIVTGTLLTTSSTLPASVDSVTMGVAGITESTCLCPPANTADANNEGFDPVTNPGEFTDSIVQEKQQAVEAHVPGNGFNIAHSEEKQDAVVLKPPTSLNIDQSEDRQTQVSVPASPHHQPPTPDCPPPSPGTAIQNIHCRIQPMEKRRSRDIETITDLSITGQHSDKPSPNSASPTTIVSDESEANTDLHRVSLTPVTEEVLPAVGNPAPTETKKKKKKPTPLPRKSSLTAESKDIHPSSNIGPALSVSSTSAGVVYSKLEGHDFEENVAHVQIQDAPQQDQVIEGLSGSVQLAEDAEVTSAVEVVEDAVQMRRSVSSGNELLDWEGHVFAGLLRGSVIGPARDVVQQLDSSHVTAAALRKKRKSTLSTFAPVMEEEKDIDPDKVMGEIDNICLETNTGRTEDNVFDDDSEDWAQIAEIISSYGGRISSSGDYALFEAQIDQLLSSKGDKKIQSVGEWLASIDLPQYENTLVANGFDDTDFLGGNILEDQDLIAIGVNNPTHRQLILDSASTLARLKPLDAANLPSSVAEWLHSLQLDYYLDTFMSHRYDSMDRVVKLWELELVTVLDITSVGHRKRILASLGERLPDTSNTISRVRVASLEALSQPKSRFEHVDLYKDYTGVRSRMSETGSEADLLQNSDQTPSLDLDGSEQHSPGRAIRDDALHIRAPHLIHYTGAIRQWRHKPEVLIRGCCNYTAHYLGSTLVKELKGAMSTQEGIGRLKKSSEVINKIPTIMLSISFKGVKFIDASSKRVVCDHEIANIFCACQDGEHMNFFAYITKDRESSKHYCHVFSVRSKELAGEIILTLGEAFEIAYQMVLKERAEQAAEEFDKLSTSDGDDSTSVSSKTSIHTV